MKNLIVALAIFAGALSGSVVGAQLAEAQPKWQDDVLCSSNQAYRTAHPAACKDIAVGSHGGGGGPDSDGDGVKNRDDAAPHDPDIQ